MLNVDDWAVNFSFKFLVFNSTLGANFAPPPKDKASLLGEYVRQVYIALGLSATFSKSVYM
jgi:hypothetical protein